MATAPSGRGKEIEGGTPASPPPSTVGASDGTEAQNERTRAEPRPPDKEYKKPSEGYPMAEAVSDKPGYVTSPYSGKVVDVRDIPPGTLVQDPTSRAEEKAYFRTPKSE